MSRTLQFYNTLTRQVEPFTLKPGERPVKMYVCGPTVYDEAHLGHARCYITWDVLYRFLRFMGYEVHYTRNITDVDDKILNRAKQNGEDPRKLAQRFTSRFHAVMADLNTLRPWQEPKATETIPEMVKMIDTLMQKKFAYETSSGVYFDVAKMPAYGQLCHQKLEDLDSGARVGVDPEKHSPLDFALWKFTPAEEMGWESPWGWGRPGWHIECSAMSWKLLGEELDIHAGGLDLVFPHHQNEIAQSEAFTGHHPFVKLWMHNGFVNVTGEKMSKSLGNFATIQQVLERYDTNTIRYFILTNHYRKPVDFNDEALEGARNWATRTAQNINLLQTELDIDPQELPGLKPGDLAAGPWITAMADDLNTAGALAYLNEQLTEANRNTVHISRRKNALHTFLALSGVLGFNFRPQATDAWLYKVSAGLTTLAESFPEIATAGKSSRQLLDALIEHREAARKNKDWGTSDTVRNRLAELGIQLKDRKDGPPIVSYEPAESSATP